jgi:DnaJ-class molecular chaperone
LALQPSEVEAAMAWMLLPVGRRASRPKISGQDQETTVLYTHYDYLELPPGASTTRVEAAYRSLKQRLNGAADEAMVRLIHEAYAVLSDPKRRHGYDETLKRAAAEADAELKATLDEKGAKVTRYVQDVPAPLIAALTAWAA